MKGRLKGIAFLLAFAMIFTTVFSAVTPTVRAESEVPLLTSTPTKYDMTVGRYFYFQAPQAGYYGLDVSEAGRVEYYWGDYFAGYDYLTPLEDKKDALMWMEKGEAYLFLIDCYGIDLSEVEISLSRVNFTGGTFSLINDEYDAFESDTDQFEMTLIENGTISYTVTEELFHFCDMEILFGKMKDWYVLAGENQAIWDCHLGANNPKIDVIVASHLDHSQGEISIGNNKVKTSTDGEPVTYTLKLEQPRCLKISYPDIEYLTVYAESNVWVCGDSGAYEEIAIFDEGEYAIRYSETRDLAPEIVVEDVSAKSFDVTPICTEYLEGVDINDETMPVFWDITGTAIEFDGEETLIDTDEMGWNDDLLLKVDGKVMDRYDEETWEDAIKVGTHQVAIYYKGAKDSYSYTVKSFEEGAKQNPVISVGQTDVAVKATEDDSRTLSYAFTPAASGHYAISVSYDGEYGWVLSDRNGHFESQFADEDGRTSYLNAGETYLLELDFFSVSQDRKATINIKKVPDITKIEVTTAPPNLSYIIPFEAYASEEDWIDGMVMTLTYADGTTEKICKDTNKDSFFDVLEFEVVTEEEIDWEKEGKYTAKVVQKDYDFSYEFDVKLIDYRDVEDTFPVLKVGENKNLKIGTGTDVAIYKIEIPTDGDYRFKGALKSFTGKSNASYQVEWYGAEPGGYAEYIDSNVFDAENTTSTLLGGFEADNDYYLVLSDWNGDITTETVDLTIEQSLVKKIELETYPAAKEGYAYVPYDFEGLQVKVTYLDGTTGIVDYGTPEWEELDLYVDYVQGTECYYVSIMYMYDFISEFEVPLKPIYEYPGIISLTKDKKVKATAEKSLYCAHNLFSFVPKEDGRYTFFVSNFPEAADYSNFGLWKYTEDGELEYVEESAAFGGDNVEMTCDLEADTTYYYQIFMYGDDAAGIKYDVTVLERTESVMKADVTRVYGGNRFKTSLAIAEELKVELGVDKFETIIVASGLNFPDALAGSFLSAKKDAPILMVNESNVGLILNYIKANLTEEGTVYLLGGTGAVPQSLEDRLTDGEKYTVERLKGKGRYDTNLAILDKAEVTDEPILVCTGTNFADSLSGSATGLPILLVNPATSEFTDAQKEFLETTNNDFVIIGGQSAVSDAYKAALEEYDKDGKVERLAGSGRYQTSVEVANWFYDNPDEVVIASALDFPDGLCGGPLAYAKGTPLILTGPNYTPAAKYLADNHISTGVALGGTGALSVDVVRNVFAMGEDDEIIDKKYN